MNKVNTTMKISIFWLMCVIFSTPAFAGGFNGSGVYQRYYNWTNDANNGINITASRFDTEDNGFATGLSNTITKDGQQTATARIPFAVGIGVTQGTSGLPGFSFIGDTHSGIYQDSTTNQVNIAANSTKVGTFNANGLDNTVIGAGTPAAGSFTTLKGGSSLTLGSSGTTSGTIILSGATSGSTTIQPTSAATGTLTLPAATDQLVGRATTDTLTNKTLTSPTITSPTVTGTLALPSGTTATTPSAGDASTKVATTAYVDRGASGASLILLSSQSASNSASISFTSIPSGYDEYIFVFDEVEAVTNGTLFYCTISEDNGSTYKSTSYNWGSQTVDTAGGVGGTGAAGAAQIQIGIAAGNGIGVSGRMTWYGLGYTFRKQATYDIAQLFNGSALYGKANGFGNYTGDTGAINAVKFTYSSGNIASGTISLYAVRNN